MVPPIRLWDAGVPNRAALAIMTRNSRMPESLAADKRQPFQWKRANPVTALKGLTQLRGVGPLVWVVGLSGLAQFTMHMSWVLYTTFKFGWGPAENGWSLFTVGVMAAIVQGGLMKQLLKRFSARAKGRGARISKGTCHIYVTVGN